MLDFSWSANTGCCWSPLSLAMTALAGLLAGYYYWVWSRSRFVRLIGALPGPKTLPLLGNIIDILKYTTNRLLVIEWIKRNGYIFRLSISYHSMVHISHHELLEPIFANSNLVTKTAEYKFLLPVSCLAAVDADKWRPRRRMLNPAFHSKILDGFMATMNEKSMSAVAQMQEILGTAESQEINVYPIMVKLAFNVLYETSLGKNTWSEEETKKYAQNLDGMEHILWERAVHKPWLRIEWIYKLTSLYQKEKRFSSFFDTFHERVIRERRELHKRINAEKYSSRPVLLNNNADEEDMISQPKERLAFLDSLLKVSEENPDEYDDNLIGNELFLFIAAGFDSSSVAMTWFLYLIAKHPEHQKLVMDELDLVFGDSDRPVTAHDLTRLKYLECCIKETLRLYPPLPMIGRYLTEEVQVGDYTLPKNLTVLLNIYMTHRNPEVFPDPEAYKPERFLPENSVGRHSYAFISFSAGARNCIGQKFAMMEIKVALSNILRRLRFSFSDTSDLIDLCATQLTVLKPKDNLCNLMVSKKSPTTITNS